MFHALDGASSVRSAHITYVEVRSALARMSEGRRITDDEHRSKRAEFESLWTDTLRIAIDDRRIHEAARLAETHVLRGYDAVQLAAAMASDLGGAFAVWDARLRAAAADEGFTLIPEET
ncbi:MAG: type II toxin-antitoxin system VapC family toxin [Actinomycetota bacterium]|nr:type II toxin-antitoxin system VapC family toxin [Actinomycetota bacterium]